MALKSENIQWKDSFNTGFSDVDLQHMGLVDIINELFELQKIEDSKTQLNQTFKKLMDYAVIHFSTEEKLMQEHHYENYISHKQEHANFITKVLALREEFIMGNNDVKLSVLNFLREWLLGHIIGTDKVTFMTINSKIR